MNHRVVSGNLFIAVLAATAGACAQQLLGPEPIAIAQRSAQHHNIPASFRDHPEGPIFWLCATQPREYIDPNGNHVIEEDHYLQNEECPLVPIK